ncbi:EcsC family protein [Metabacillus sp. 22489]|uniref:EcsC family protein n=1 Tax=Metabacillus sp. 22489 TaxID=3453928 RepID=UPI003F82AE4D
MMSGSEKLLLAEIEKWEQELQKDIRTDVERTLHKWINKKMNELPVSVKRILFSKFDKCFFHLHSIIQGSYSQQDARNQILLTAKSLGEDIYQLKDLQSLSIDQLHYLANLQTSKHRIYSLIQGGMTGTGGILLSGVEIPAQILINLRAVQLIAMSYGYEINTPYEMMTSLKVFHASLMPKHLQSVGWSELKNEIHIGAAQAYFYEGEENLANNYDVEFLLKQIVKLSVIALLKKKIISGVPLISMMIGAGMNYRLTRQVTNFSNIYYQYRIIFEKNSHAGGYDE